MSDIREDLLQPSLAIRQAPVAAPYSNQVLFLCAFIGGPPAALACWTLNSLRLKTLRRDLPLIAAGALLYVSLLLWWSQAGVGSLRPLLEDLLDERSAALLVRLLALALAGLSAWLHRREQAACQLMGVPRPNGWLPGLTMIFLGGLLNRLLQEVLQ